MPQIGKKVPKQRTVYLIKLAMYAIFITLPKILFIMRYYLNTIPNQSEPKVLIPKANRTILGPYESSLCCPKRLDWVSRQGTLGLL